MAIPFWFHKVDTVPVAAFWNPGAKLGSNMYITEYSQGMTDYIWLIIYNKINKVQPYRFHNLYMFIWFQYVSVRNARADSRPSRRCPWQTKSVCFASLGSDGTSWQWPGLVLSPFNMSFIYFYMLKLTIIVGFAVLADLFHAGGLPCEHRLDLIRLLPSCLGSSFEGLVLMFSISCGAHS